VDAYFSADVETDGPIPGVFSMLSFALVYAGSFDGRKFKRPVGARVNNATRWDKKGDERARATRGRGQG
jgi:hypothetical protein